MREKKIVGMDEKGSNSESNEREDREKYYEREREVSRNREKKNRIEG